MRGLGIERLSVVIYEVNMFAMSAATRNQVDRIKKTYSWKLDCPKFCTVTC
jgi:hypothetical protein